MLPSIYYPLYTFNFPKYWLLRDEPLGKQSSLSGQESSHTDLKFHISAGDYIMTLATILKFFEESISQSAITPDMRKLQLETIKKVIQDLRHLDKQYKIVPKSENESK